MVDYPNDWKLESIGEIFNTITDYVAAGSFKDLSDNVKYYNSPNYAQLIRTRDIKSKFKNRGFIFINKQAYDYLWRVHFNDTKIIMPNIGNCGEVYFVEVDKLPHERCVLGPNAIMLFDTDNDMKFIYYALQRNDFQKDLKDIISPSGQTKFNKTDLSKIKIRIPADIREQKNIADTLLIIDRHIENLEKLIKKKKMVRDGAVEDLMTGKTRLDGFECEWEEVNLGDSVSIVRGASPRPIENHLTLDVDGINWIKIGDAPKNGKYINKTEEKIKKDSAIFSVLVNPGDFILSNSMSYGRPYIVKSRGCIHDGWLKLFGFDKKLNDDYLFYLLSLDNIQSQYRSLAAGSGVKNLNKEIVKKVKIKIPTDIKEQEAIASILISMDEEIENLEKEKEKIEKIKAGAMDNLLTGKVRLI